jgi:hypothetical protein
MYDDPIVQEIHQIRESLCQKFQFDIQKIFADVKQREQKHRDKLVNLPVKQGRSPNESLKLTPKGGR